MKLISVQLVGNPKIEARAVLPFEPISDKNTKQFCANEQSTIKIVYENKEKEIKHLLITNIEGYCYDGATIPFNIGKGDMRLLIPALFHDIMCEKKKVVSYNRKLSSLIFKELLLQCHINKAQAQLMYIVVDTYQKLQKGWKNDS